MDRQIKTYQIVHIWYSRLRPKASFMKGVERGTYFLNIANLTTYIIGDVVIKLLRDEVIQTQNPYAILIPY